MSKEMIKDIAMEGAKASPPVAVVGTSIAKGWAEGWTINHTVAALTIVYLLLQIGWLVWRWHKAAKGQEVKAE
ncbi:MAG: hypothetical protein KJ856_22510 [Gammaproteobacteria bacterium]|nr:hypothetical protein [Gammaproteobacteria bacterium]MBU1505933.1 hypothetical protein [Gammaproteobacteria bacterium]MBU2119861.1 hypothetical protein [Gammaproteobacteria bacterium]MBU2189761.1 hypothetical protein [Gammaproteobacteria bacterium]